MMATAYCYTCPCGTWEASVAAAVAICANNHMAVRDYRAEGVGLGNIVEIRRESGHTKSEIRDLFLPTLKDYQSPSDPTGERGLRQWNETHGPKESNKSPMYPELPKRSF